MDLLRPLLNLVLSPDCYKKLLIERTFEVVCLKLVLSKVLGYGITVGASFVKVPQILKIWGNKSGAGISLVSAFLELFAITTHAAYCFVNQYPFSTWGDSLFLDIETVIIVFLIFRYGPGTKHAVMFLSAFMGIASMIIGGVIPPSVLVILEGTVLPVALTAKLLQAYTNRKNGNTGNLSAVSCFLLFAGGVARIYTSIVETGDSMMIITFIMTSIANGVIAAQIVYYWTPTKKWQEELAKNKKRQ